jgi:CheY-like chemotaxis protein
MSETSLRIVLVGHCGPDAFMLRSAVGRAVSGASVEMVSDRVALDRAKEGAAVLLVNRVLDGEFDGLGGIELIRELASARESGGPAIMLVSNLPEAQAEAEEAGAAPGFGKKDANSELARRRLAQAIAGRGGEQHS